MPNQDNIHAKTGSKNTPNQARKTAKSGSKNTPNQAQTIRQIRLKLLAKSGPSYVLHATGTQQKREKRNMNAPILIANFAAQKRQLT